MAKSKEQRTITQRIPLRGQQLVEVRLRNQVAIEELLGAQIRGAGLLAPGLDERSIIEAVRKELRTNRRGLRTAVRELT